MYRNTNPYEEYGKKTTDDMQVIWHSADISTTEGFSETHFADNSIIYDQLAVPSDEDIYEPTLLEELEIYPDRIFRKISTILNPLNSSDDYDYHLVSDFDLAGPLFFYLIFAMSLFLSGSKAHFGYVYGISAISCFAMFCLLTLMTPGQVGISPVAVASILGYSLIPIVLLSFIGVLVPLRNSVGIILGLLAVAWSSMTASKLFVLITGDKEQQFLSAYPCCLISGLYTLLILY